MRNVPDLDRGTGELAMNIGRSDFIQASESSPHLESESLYSNIPHWREIIAAVRAGEAEFVDTLAQTGLLLKFGRCTSTVHPYEDIEGHAFILGIPSTGRWDEIQTKSYLTYASHWIDDFFDSPERVGNPAQLMNDRSDIRIALANMGPVGQVGFAMANRVSHPDAVYKALHRMLYGGLVQRSSDHAERHSLVEEYRSVASQFIDPALVEQIRHLQPEAYWTTNKTVLELLCAAEKEIDFNSSELWNLVYAPALYYQDADEESIRGELSFEDDEAPRIAEMARMIRLGATYLSRLYSKDGLQMRQLKFLAALFKNLPNEVLSEYRSLWGGCDERPPASLGSVEGLG
jgi:hypothetical protein